jgi:hypothetical protein
LIWTTSCTSSELLSNKSFDVIGLLGEEDFDEALKHGGKLVRAGYAEFDPRALLRSAAVYVGFESNGLK